MDDESTHNYWLFIDNSNLFIEGQKFYATMNNWHVRMDPRFRIDFVKLINHIASDPKRVKNAYLYGSEPPSMDPLRKRIKAMGIDVKIFKRNSNNKEKEVDLALAVDATKCACKESGIGMYGTFVFLTGDRDISPAINAVIDEGFKVHVVSYKAALSNRIRNINGIEIMYLDDVIENCCYLCLDYKKKPPINNSITVALTEPLKEDKIKAITSQAAEIFRLPCMYKWNEARVKDDFLLILIFVPYSKPDSGEYDFGELYRRHIVELKQRIAIFLGSDQKFIKEIVDSVSFNNKLPDTHEIIYVDEIDEEISDDLDETACCFSNTANINSNINTPRSRSFSSVSSISSADGWITKQDYRQKRDSQMYSDYCIYGFTCKKGKNCEYKHTSNEKKVFSYFDGKGVKNYKSEQCPYPNCNFKKEPLKCRFAHDLNEARCYKCEPKKGVCKHHWMKDCEKLNNVTIKI